MMSRLAEPIGPEDHTLGRPGAPAQLVEYGDYECPFCARAHHVVTVVLRTVGNDVRYAFRQFPLTQIHPHALLAAQAAAAAGAQGRFWQMHSILFEHQDALETDALVEYATILGLDTHRFAHDLRMGTYLPTVQHDFHTGVRSGVQGTPTFFLDGLRHGAGWDADSLTSAIRDVLLRSGSPQQRPHAQR
jgi:protein-disulfide isomerase